VGLRQLLEVAFERQVGDAETEHLVRRGVRLADDLASVVEVRPMPTYCEPCPGNNITQSMSYSSSCSAPAGAGGPDPASGSHVTEQNRPPGQSAAERDKKNDIALLHPARPHRFVERDGDRRDDVLPNLSRFTTTLWPGILKRA